MDGPLQRSIVGRAGDGIRAAARAASFRMLRRSTPGTIALALGLLLLGAKVAAEPAVYEGFDGPGMKWRLSQEDHAAEVLAQECARDQARPGGGSEWLIVAAPAGDSAHLIYSTPRLPVLDEVEARLWVKSNRPSIRLAARVVFPRSVDDVTHAPRTAIVSGTQYDRVGGWQQLSLSDVPRLLAGQVRVIRATPGVSIDPGEAYVDAIVLTVPGEPGGTTVWTDELEIDGIVLDRIEDSRTAGPPPTNNTPAHESGVVQVGWRQELGSATGRSSLGEAPDVRLHGTTLSVAGKPFVPRAIEWNGEPLEFLADRGFNTVLLRQLPSPEQSAEAFQRGLWFICTPPLPDALDQHGLGQTTDRVLAWYLGSHVTSTELDYFRRWAERVRQHDPYPGRPVIVTPEVDWLPLSQSADALLVHHPRGSHVPSSAYAQWLDERPRLTRPGTPYWAQLDTQVDDVTRQQAAALAPLAETLDMGLDDGRLENLVQVACTHDCRGFVFLSSSRLDAMDAVTKRRASLLELINRRLQVIEPWLANGKIIGEAIAADGSSTAVVMQMERARLLVLDDERGASSEERMAGGARRSSHVDPPRSFIVPGVPESNQAYLLSLASLRSLPGKRIAGGYRVVLEPEDDGFVLLTEDQHVVTGLRRRLERTGREVVALEKELAAARAESVSATGRRLEQLGYAEAENTPSIARAQEQINRCDSLLASGRVQEAYLAASSARRILHQAADQQRERVMHTDDLTSVPLAQSYDTLVQQAQFLNSLGSLRGKDNLLQGGDFEDLGLLVQYGWRHVSHEVPDVDAQAELSAVRPYHGNFSLQLSADAKSRKRTASVITDAPVWITSPPMPVTAGQVVEITGWVRVPGSTDRRNTSLQIVDSLGGTELALDVNRTEGWQPFRMIRAVPQPTDVKITFALTGLGTASIDAVMVRALSPPAVRRLPPISSTPSAPATATQPPATTLYPSTGR